MALKFEPIAGQQNLLRQTDYTRILTQTPQIASDYSFVNLWGWADVYDLEWAWDSQLVWIRQSRPTVQYWAPVGPWHAINWAETIDAHFCAGSPFIRVPEDLLSIWEDTQTLSVKASESRGHWDYIYSVRELCELKGKRFHKKKNLLNQFLKKYDYRFVPFEPGLVDQALALQNDWCVWRDCESVETLAAENQVIETILTHWEQIDGLLGGAIEVDNRLVAYTVAEALSADTIMIHFEKGSPGYKGVYQAINQMFLAWLGDRYTDVNREQDLDDPGLRKAKLSYNPSKYIVKHSIVLER